MHLYLIPMKYILCITVEVILLVLSRNQVNSCNTIFYHSLPITKFHYMYYFFVLFWYGTMHLNYIPTKVFNMSITFFCHCNNIFSYLDISYCPNFWHYVINKPYMYVFVIIHFVIIVIVHLFISYFCCFELISEHSCQSIFLCICSEHHTLPFSYLLLSPKYLSDCGNSCSSITMSCFIFDNG